MPALNRSLYRGSYARRARAIRTAAYADPSTKCWRCGRVMADIKRKYPKAEWHAGHLIDSEPTSPLAAECSPCNETAGRALQLGKREPRSRQW